MSQVHAVKYVTGDDQEEGGLASVDALVLGPEPASGATVTLYSIQDGTLKERTSVPHGSASQGDTWY